MARKKARSPAQKRNDKRLGQMAKKRARKSTPKRRKSTVRKTIKRVTRRKPVAKRKTSRRSSSGKRKIIDKIPLLNNKTVQRIGFGLGMGSIAGIIASRIPVPAVQQNANLISTGVAFATDPLAGVVKLALSGGLGQLGGLLGGGGSSAPQTNGGFA